MDLNRHTSEPLYPPELDYSLGRASRPIISHTIQPVTAQIPDSMRCPTTFNPPPDWHHAPAFSHHFGPSSFETGRTNPSGHEELRGIYLHPYPAGGFHFSFPPVDHPLTHRLYQPRPATSETLNPAIPRLQYGWNYTHAKAQNRCLSNGTIHTEATRASSPQNPVYDRAQDHHIHPDQNQVNDDTDEAPLDRPRKRKSRDESDLETGPPRKKYRCTKGKERAQSFGFYYDVNSILQGNPQERIIQRPKGDNEGNANGHEDGYYPENDSDFALVPGTLSQDRDSLSGAPLHPVYQQDVARKVDQWRSIIRTRSASGDVDKTPPPPSDRLATEHFATSSGTSVSVGGHLRGGYVLRPVLDGRDGAHSAGPSRTRSLSPQRVKPEPEPSIARFSQIPPIEINDNPTPRPRSRSPAQSRTRKPVELELIARTDAGEQRITVEASDVEWMHDAVEEYMYNFREMHETVTLRQFLDIWRSGRSYRIDETDRFTRVA